MIGAFCNRLRVPGKTSPGLENVFSNLKIAIVSYKKEIQIIVTDGNEVTHVHQLCQLKKPV